MRREMVDESSELNVGHRLSALREHSGMSVRTLATKSGFSPSFISQVENGQASPSIASLYRIAEALGLGLSEFFADHTTQGSSIVRVNQRPAFESNWSKARLESLRGISAGRLHPTIITLLPGGSSGKNPSALQFERFVLVLEGSVTYESDGDAFVLASGDSVAIAPAVTCRLSNEGRGPAQFLHLVVM